MMLEVPQKVEFVFNSNKIENIQIPMDYYMLNEIHKFPEINGHFNAYDYMVEHCKEPLTEKHIKAMHKLLTAELLDKNNNGKYRRVPVFIGGHTGCNPIEIKGEMHKLIAQCKRAKTEKECWECHDEFEVIHPFIDGNGRTGRLILNWMRLKNGFPLFIVKHTDDMRWTYYEKIEAYRREKMDILFHSQYKKDIDNDKE